MNSRACIDPALVLEDAQQRLIARINGHPFLQACRQGRLSRARLDTFLVQQAKYSAHFTRYLCALMSNLESGEDLVRLAANLVEETGGGDGSLPHAQLYADMLADFDLQKDQFPTHTETQLLIDTMYVLCRHPNPAHGLGAMCLGAEAIVPTVYSAIVEGYGHVGVAAQRLGFFLIHIECDDGHAQTMRDIMAGMAHRQPPSVERMVAAGEMALHARYRFFDRLLSD